VEEALSSIAKPRILLITQWFDPEPTFKGLLFAQELVQQGFSVEVVTGFPNYPGGKLYPGYKIKWIQREFIDGVHVTRLPLYPNHNQSAIKRVLNYCSFALSVFFYGAFVAKRADIMYAYHPPLTVGVAASMIRSLRRMPLVYDIQDMWPDTLRATGMLNNPRLLKLINQLCNWVYCRVDRIVVISPGFKRLLVERNVPEDKIDIIYNWADEKSLISPVGELHPNFPRNSQFKIVFAGNIGKAQALDAVLDAAKILQNRKSKVCFVIVGGGVDVSRLKLYAKNLSLDNLVFLPPVPMSEVGTILDAADALIVHLKKDPLFEITIPSKTQAYMAVGKPLLMAVDGDAADLVRQSNCGLIAESENSQSIANAAESLANMCSSDLQNMGERASQFYQDNLGIKVGVTKFSAVFKTLIGRI
jgi:glycosyltransferase involved in cell wall biosynthesis